MKNTYLTVSEKAQAELKEIALKKEALEHRAKFLREVIAFAQDDGPGETQVVEPAPPVEPAATPNTKQAQASAFCEGFVSKFGPATGPELYTALLESPLQLGGQTRGQQMINMSGYLNQVGKLRYYREHGRWWFADRPYPVPGKGRGFFTDQ